MRASNYFTCFRVQVIKNQIHLEHKKSYYSMCVAALVRKSSASQIVDIKATHIYRAYWLCILYVTNVHGIKKLWNYIYIHIYKSIVSLCNQHAWYMCNAWCPSRLQHHGPYTIWWRARIFFRQTVHNIQEIFGVLL